MTGLQDRAMRAKILDVRETRRLASPLELRTDAPSGHIVLEGYASTFHAYDVHGGVAAGGWVEQLDRRAFDKTLNANPDVMLLINHEGLPLARTTSGNLTLRADNHGLLIHADLDPSDPDVQRLVPKMSSRGGRPPLLNEMSFAFHVRAQDWSNDYTHRMITEVDLRKGDVSVVNYGMNPNTAAMLAVDTLAALSSDDLVEIRKMDQQRVARAMHVLGCARATTPKKYGDVSNFADPGYLDSAGKPAKDGNGQKRYPLNSAARVRNAAARFAQNKGRYTAEQQGAIMGKIRAAAKRFGVQISDESKAWSSPRSGHRAFTQPYVWQPDVAASTGQDQPYDKGYPSDYDATLGGRPDVTPGADLGVPKKGGYDAHNELYTKQMYALWLLANDEICPGGDMCPGDQCPDHGQEMDALDGLEQLQDGDFGGKQAKPFKKGGGRQGDDEDDGDGKRSDWDHTDSGDIDEPADPEFEGDHEGSEEEPDNDMDDHIDLSLAAALEKTIVSCYQLAEASGDRDLRNLLARARRQVRDLQGIPGREVDISRKLSELRAESGVPDTITVSQGLRAIAQSGFADMMKPKKKVG
jgi:HK97 family phage prohead protease